MKKQKFKCCYLLLICLAAPLFASEPAIRFAWLSDTHVGAGSGAADLRAAVHDINGLNGIDFVVHSGDVTEMGSNAELQLAKVILDSLKVPYYLIPGNHDTKWSESGCTKFAELWGSDKFQFDFRGYRFIGLHQGPLMRMGDGHFSPEDLRWLDSLLINLPDPAPPLIFITHYPIDASVDNWYQFLDRVKQFPTSAILFGHGHRNRVYDLEGVPGVMGRSTLRREQSPGGFNIVTIRRDTLTFFERLIDPDRERIAAVDSVAANGRRPISEPGISPAWHKIVLAPRDFVIPSRRFDRPDFSVNLEFPKVREKWRVDTQFSMTAAPCVWRNWVVVGNRAGRVFGLSVTDGKKQWIFQIKGGIFASAAAAHGKVVFGATDNHIYCLNIETGQLLWRVATSAPVVAAPQIYRGTVYIGGSDGKFRAIELASGQLRWEFSGVTGFVETRPLIYQDRVIFGAWDTFLYSLNRKDGTLAWKWSNGNPGRLYSPAACWPVAANDKVFIVAPDRFMTAINARTGATIWRSNSHKVRESIGIAENGNIIYARCMEDTLLAFSAPATAPELIWAASCGYGYDIDPSMPIEKDGVIFFGTKNGLLIAVAAKTGQVKFKYRAGVALLNTVTPLDAHRVVLTDMDGRVMLVENVR
jgi:outer membrane protein assembly factor BamB/predicted phosphodiesterase